MYLGLVCNVSITQILAIQIRSRPIAPLKNNPESTRPIFAIHGRQFGPWLRLSTKAFHLNQFCISPAPSMKNSIEASIWILKFYDEEKFIE